MKKYRLSKYISVKDIDTTHYDAIPARYAKEHFILTDKSDDSEYLINSTIKYYIDKFSICKTQQEVAKEIENDLQLDSKEIRDTCSRFFRFLCKTKILVPEGKIENVIEDVIKENPLFKEGDSIDNFHILSILSGRRYTDLYLAEDQITGGSYVIKLLNGKKTASAARFQKELTEIEAEYKMLQKTNGIPAINKAYGFNKTPYYAYIILEYIEGRSLSKFIKAEAATLTDFDCIHIIEGIINAFSCLHENHIIHGDIHSSNILISNEKNVKIIDLGLSRNIEIEDNEVVNWGGVYYYMPPERINSSTFKKFSKEADLFSDVYQIGVLIYLVLYNRLPFEGFIWEELAENIKKNDFPCPDVSFLNFHIPESILKIVKKCLSKQPSKRYRNGAEILADFRKHVLSQKELVEM